MMHCFILCPLSPGTGRDITDPLEALQYLETSWDVNCTNMKQLLKDRVTV